MIGRRGFIAGLLAATVAPRLPAGPKPQLLDMSLLGESTTFVECGYVEGGTFAIGPWQDVLLATLPGRFITPTRYVLEPGEHYIGGPVLMPPVPVTIEGSNGHA